MPDTATIDFETGALADLKKTGIERQTECPHFRVNCLGYSFDDAPAAVWTPGMPAPRELLAHIEAGGRVVAHNAPFEYQVWTNWLAPRMGWPRLTHKQLDCTMARALALSLPGGLDKVCEAMRLPFTKDNRGRRAMLKYCKPLRLDPIEWCSDLDEWLALLTYCAHDVAAERALDRVLPRLSASEKEMWEMHERINQRGVAVDVDCVNNALEFVQREDARLSAEVRALTGGKVTSANQVAALIEWLAANGLETQKLRRADVASLLKSDVAQRDGTVRRLLELRKEGAKASVAKLQAMANRACADGRARGTIQYHGAGTGRAAGRGIQTQNMVRPPGKFKDADAEYVMDALRLGYDLAAPLLIQRYGSVMQAISWAMRGFLVAGASNE